MANKKKEYWYVIVMSRNGAVFVTETNNWQRTARWDKDKKPISFTKSDAQYLALGLENTKQIDIIENLEDVNKMKTVIEYKELGTVAGEETVIDDKTVEKETTIEERKTVA